MGILVACDRGCSLIQHGAPKTWRQGDVEELMMLWLRRNNQRDFYSLPISENFPVYTNKYRMIIVIYFDLVLPFIKTMKLHP